MLMSFFSFVSVQVLLSLPIDGLLQMSRYGTSFTCLDICGGKVGQWWEQCCTTGDLCNNLPIPANITLAEMQNCYEGSTVAECTGTSTSAVSSADLCSLANNY